MTDASYRIVPRGAGSFDVEIGKPDGRRKTVPGFRSEHEANAWIIQAMRMVRDAGPWTPLVPRKPAAKPTNTPVAATSQEPVEKLLEQTAGSGTPPRRVRNKTSQERSEAQPPASSR